MERGIVDVDDDDDDDDDAGGDSVVVVIVVHFDDDDEELAFARVSKLQSNLISLPPWRIGYSNWRTFKRLISQDVLRPIFAPAMQVPPI